ERRYSCRTDRRGRPSLSASDFQCIALRVSPTATAYGRGFSHGSVVHDGPVDPPFPRPRAPVLSKPADGELEPFVQAHHRRPAGALAELRRITLKALHVEPPEPPWIGLYLVRAEPEERRDLGDQLAHAVGPVGADVHDVPLRNVGDQGRDE